MIADHQTDTVYISDLLTVENRPAEHGLRALLADRLRVIPGTRDIWCRDFMPIQLDTHRFVQFRYDPDYLKDTPELCTKDAANLLGLENCVYSDLVIDGGNIVRWNDMVILTDKIYAENPGLECPHLRDRLREVLEVDRLIVIPTEPDDTIGHADGMVRFVDEKTLLVNDYRKVDPAFGERLAEALRGFDLLHFPYCPTETPGPDPDIWPATGVYINFLQIDDVIICPTFDLPDDQRAMRLLDEFYPEQKVVPLSCEKLKLTEDGGVLNCITWNIKA